MSTSLKLKLQNYIKSEHERLMNGKKIADFKPGDIIDVEYTQNSKQKDNIFTGTCIKRTSKGAMSSVTIVKMSSHGVQIVRTFNICHPSVLAISVRREAKKHNRAKLYHLVLKTDKV